jgi:hypothetical protein
MFVYVMTVSCSQFLSYQEIAPKYIKISSALISGVPLTHSALQVLHFQSGVHLGIVSWNALGISVLCVLLVIQRLRFARLK